MKKSKTDNLDLEKEHTLSIPKYSSTYIDLSSNRVIFIAEPFTKDLASEITALLLHYDRESNEDITIYIHSDGGDISALLNIYDIMRLTQSPITTVAMGKAYSAGAFLLMAGDYRMAFAHSEIMIHGAQFFFPLPGKEHIDDGKDYLKFVDRSNEQVMRIMVEATGKTMEQVKEICSKDRYLTAKEALEYKLIDAII